MVSVLPKQEAPGEQPSPMTWREGALATLAPDVRFFASESLPFGGEVRGADEVRERIAAMDDMLRQSPAQQPGMIADREVVALFRQAVWNDGGSKRFGSHAGRVEEVAEWWFLKDGKVSEILIFVYDVGLFPSGGATAASAPDASVMGRSAQFLTSGNPDQDLVEKVYGSVIGDTVMDASQYLGPNIALFESAGLPYGAGLHLGLADIGTVYAGVERCLVSAQVDVKLVVSNGSHVSVLVKGVLKHDGSSVLLNEDFHIRDGRIDWYRAYYWDAAAVHASWQHTAPVAEVAEG